MGIIVTGLLIHCLAVFHPSHSLFCYCALRFLRLLIVGYAALLLPTRLIALLFILVNT